MASNNPKKFWKRKDGKLILNPLNNQHLIMCTTNPCGDYWAIFGKRSYGAPISNTFQYSVGIYFVKDGKAQWIQTDYDDYGEIIEIHKCASIDINGRPNGLQRYIHIYHIEQQATPEDEIYDEENDDWIYVPPTYTTVTHTEETLTEWYRLSKCYSTESEAIQAFYYPCGITEAPFPDEWSSEWQQCVNNYWLPKTIWVSSPLSTLRQEPMSMTYWIFPQTNDCDVENTTFTYQYNPNNKQLCGSSDSGCSTGTISCKQRISYNYSDCAMAYMRTNNYDLLYDYMTAGVTTITDEVSTGCAYANIAYRAMSNTIAPHVYSMMTKKQTFFDAYYLKGGGGTQITAVYNGTWYNSNKIIKTTMNYAVSRGVQNDFKISEWYRFCFKRTQQTPQQAIGLKIQIDITDTRTIKYNKNSSSSSVSTSSFTTDVQFDKYYEDLPIPTYFDIFNLKKELTCITHYYYDQQTGQLEWIGDECDNANNGCTILYQPGPWYEPYNQRSQRFKVEITILDVNYPSDFIKSGYAIQGEKDYGN